MSKIPFLKERWFVMLASAFLIGILLMSNHMSVLTIHVEQHRVSSLATSPSSAVPEHEESHHVLCCSACCPFCIFIVFQSVSVIPCGDTLKVVNSIPIFQAVYLKSIIPPPKA
jgi:hypothetical protein